MNYRRSGFTVLEILLVIAILAGAGFFLIIKIPYELEKERIETSSLRLLGDLREVQQAAVSENLWYKVKFYPDKGEYKIFRQGEFIRSVKLQEGVVFRNRPPELTFLPTGAPVPGMTIILAAGDRERRIIVAPVMGRIREEIIK